jgi:S1-C subfamily serine protease
LSDGDLIIALDGQSVGDIDDLQRLLTEERADRDMPLTIIRRTEKIDLTVRPAG